MSIQRKIWAIKQTNFFNKKIKTGGGTRKYCYFKFLIKFSFLQKFILMK